jgi:CheY-like chemotaxis protein
MVLKQTKRQALRKALRRTSPKTAIRPESIEGVLQVFPEQAHLAALVVHEAHALQEHGEVDGALEVKGGAAVGYIGPMQRSFTGEQVEPTGWRSLRIVGTGQFIKPQMPLPEVEPRDPSQPTVLFVDDDERIVASMRALVTDGMPDVRVLTATSAEAAADLLAREPVDVIVSDYRMPGADGAAFLKAAARLQPKAARLALSGSPDAFLVAKGGSEGYVVLGKPVEPDLLLRMLHTMLAKSRR